MKKLIHCAKQADSNKASLPDSLVETLTKESRYREALLNNLLASNKLFSLLGTRNVDRLCS
jgi:hypothetical protein